MKNKLTIIIQARLNSSRFPNKVLKKINGKSLIEILLIRLKKSKYIERIIVASSKNFINQELEDICNKNNIFCYRGSENNVLNRFIKINESFPSKYIARITADCPLIDPETLDNIFEKFIKLKVDFISNNDPPSFPDGFDIEIFKSYLLNKVSNYKTNLYDKEHVTPALKRLANKCYTLQSKINYSNLRITVDEIKDFKYLAKLLKFYDYNYNISQSQITNYLIKNQIKLTKNLKRNYGSSVSYGVKFWNRANKFILNGNNFFSKRPDLYEPDLWPTYFSKAKGCHIWDLEGNKFLDATYMGIGTNVLGYSNKIIDDYVISQIRKGNMSTLNSHLEIDLAQQLLSLDKKFSKVKFVRGGAEASSLALRLARCCSSKNNVAFCGYHGWQDWYLSSNLNYKDNLKNHLFSGISTKGINKKLAQSSFPFEYNNYNNFLSVVQNNNIGVVIAEVERNIKPKNDFLIKIQNYCNKNNIILIFDECTSGFKETFGGLYLKYNLSPDIVIYGKALGNGYAINAVLMKEFVAKEAKNTFASSTFWSEKVGVSAGIKTLELMKSTKSWITIKNKGKFVKKTLLDIAKNNNIEINVYGLDSMPSFSLLNRNNSILKQYLTSQMLKHKILANFSIYLSTTHSDKDLDRYFNATNEIFEKFRKYDDKYFESILKTRNIEHFRKIN